MSDFIELRHIKSNKRKKQVNDTAKIIGKGAGKLFKTISKGVSKITNEIKERQKPENQLKRLKDQHEILEAKAKVMKEQEKINKLRPKGNTGMGGLGGFVDNANKNIEDLFGTNMLNNKKNKGGLI